MIIANESEDLKKEPPAFIVTGHFPAFIKSPMKYESI